MGVCTLALNDDDCKQLSKPIRHEINYYQVTKARTEKMIIEYTDEVKHHHDGMSECMLKDSIKTLAEEESDLAEYIELNKKLMSCGCKRATNWEGKIPGD